MTSLSSIKTRDTAFWGSLLLFVSVIFIMALSGPVGKYLWLFSSLYSCAFILLWILFKTFPDEWPEKRQFLLIFFISVLCRLFFFEFPASYDVNRYIWEGYLFNQDINPYLYAPDDPAVKSFTNSIWHNINHKDKTACYPPMMTIFFNILVTISKSPLFFKGIMILFDIAVIPILALLIRLRKIDLKYLLIYALNPLVLVFISGEGHLDSIQIFFICLALYFNTIKKDGWSFFALGCAVMSKYYALILFPFFVTRRNWKKSLIMFIPFLTFIPFLDSGGSIFSSLMAFGTNMHYNDSLAVLLRLLFNPSAVWVSISLLFICLTIIFLFVHDTIKSAYLAIACLLLLIPTLHPWYIALVTPFLVIFPSKAWLYLHFAVAFTFPVLHVECNTGSFQEIYWLKGFEYLPFFAILIFNFIKQRPVPSLRPFKQVKDISVVIPALNESENLSGALGSIRSEKGLLESVVADGGSSDNTKEVADDLGAMVVESEKGRGLQIARGVNPCQGDIILILHADCRIVPGTFDQIIQALNNNPQCIGGSLGMHYNFNSFKTQLLSRLNNIRARWSGIAFGDQGQFFRKEALDTIGGFPEQMLMEDIELSFRLNEKGEICHLANGIVVSHRRWRDREFFSNFGKVASLCFVYLIKRRLGIGDKKRTEFYNRYYTTKDILNVKP